MPTDIAENIKRGSHVVEHKRVWFPSYPYEWPLEMLFAAGQLTMEVARTIAPSGFRLKDATPYNVLFCGHDPVFVDVLSFEQRPAGDPHWLAYGQFLRMFVLPLLAAETCGSTLAQIFLTYRDGIEPEAIYRNLSWTQRLRRPFLNTVSIPTWLGHRVKPSEKQLYKPTTSMPADQAEYIFRSQLQRAMKVLSKAKPRSGKRSTWSSYTECHSYESLDYSLKLQTVEEWLKQIKPSSVLDVGCNTGDFSKVAATAGARVVAIDIDPVVVGTTWRRARAENLNILPLAVNFAWPTPAVGWRNSEYGSFLERAEKAFDTVMMLAVLHHLLVTDRIPLKQVVDVCGKLTNRHLIIEFVSKDDEMFKSIARGRDSLHADFTQQAFERAFSDQFNVVEKRQVKGNLRWLYLLRKRTG